MVSNPDEYLGEDGTERRRIDASETNADVAELRQRIAALESEKDLRDILDNIIGPVKDYLDRFIDYSFCFLIFVSTAYAVVSIVYDLFKSFILLWNKEPHGEAETYTLKTTEHIFLYLLPLFVILGFFQFYKMSARYFILGGHIETIDPESSSTSVNLAKTLFISSVISYVIIKVIEVLIKLNEGQSNVPPLQLISFGALLIILMTYFIFLTWKKH